MLGFPHIEMLIPAFGLLAVATWLRARTAAGWASAGVIVLFVLTIREDAGLHLFLVLLAMVLVSASTRDGRPMRRLMGLAALCLAGGFLALWLQRKGVPDGGQQLGNVYFGHPALSHVSLGSLARRLGYWGTRREYIFLPLLALMVSAGLREQRGVHLLVGGAIALPWLGLSLVAAAQQAGDLWSYYCFPLVFMTFWPLLLGQVESQAARELLCVQITMSGLSTAAFVAIGVLPYSYVGDGGSHDKAPWTHLWPPSLTMIRLTEAGLTGRGGWLFDYGAAAIAFGSLRPGQFRAGLVFDDAEVRVAHGFIRFDIEPRFLAAQVGALERVFPNCMSVAGTVLRACTRMEPADKRESTR
jgi:hypothetical protein